MGRKLFCELGPAAYKLSAAKETLRRKIGDAVMSFSRRVRFAKLNKKDKTTQLPVIVKSHSSVLLRRLNGVDMKLQENKAKNIALACEKINGMLVRPGETFSFWRSIGRPTAKKGYLDGLVISKNGFLADVGGGLCQMANMIHWLVLNSPMTVTELHHHTDALFPDDRRRVPFGTGTSVCYNYIDYRFTNGTDQAVQILVWTENGELCGELRAERQFPFRYRLTEENHHFTMENGKYYRVSQVWRSVIDRASGETSRRELILDNHSEVMYDYSLIPQDQIRNGAP
ncbi:MAG: VanW family protein [Clostridiales bacterium]|nr:VanW family protein [Clostridiales bacterium]